MKKLLCVFLLAIMLFGALMLTSCDSKDGIPEGMQLVGGGDAAGYYFYGPEEWVVANLGNICCTYASKIDLSSMTFVESEKPDTSIEEYFESEKSKFPYEITVTVNGEDCNFGNADKPAVKYVYTYTYKEISYTTMQIFIEQNDSFFIFTYTANNTESPNGSTYYDRYLEKVSAVIESFRFTIKTQSNKEEIEYKRDEDGYILVTDRTLTGYDMYVPDSYSADYSSSYVSVSREDGTNITMSQVTYAGVYANDYWETRRKNLEAIADKVTDEFGQSVTSLRYDPAKIGVQIPLDNVKWALTYEYSYILDGEGYHVYQVFIVESSTNGYVFTYTATEENYEKHLSEMENVLRKIDY